MFFVNMLYYRILIVQEENYIVLSNQWYLWFALINFLEFFTNNKQDHRLQNIIKFDLLVWPTFEIISDFSMHNVYWDTLYIEKKKNYMLSMI